MSFFKNLFGGSEKPKAAPKPAPPPQVNKTEQKRIETEKVIVNLQSQIESFEDNEKKFEHKIEVIKQKAKEYLENDKKKEAKKLLEEATRLQKQMEKYSIRRKALVDKKSQLEEAIINMETIDAMEAAQSHMKDQEKQSQKLGEMILDGQQAKMISNEIDSKIKDLVGNESEDEQVDDMMKQLQGEINKEKKKKIEMGANVKVPVTTKNQKMTEDDEIARMMAELA